MLVFHMISLALFAVIYRTNILESSSTMGVHETYPIGHTQASTSVLGGGTTLFALIVSSYYFYASGTRDVILCHFIKKIVRLMIAFTAGILSFFKIPGLTTDEQEVVHFFSIIPISIAIFTMFESYPSTQHPSDVGNLHDESLVILPPSLEEMKKFRHEQRRKLLESGEPLMKVLSENNEFELPPIPLESNLICSQKFSVPIGFSFHDAEVLSSILLFFEILLFFPDATLFVFLLCPLFIEENQNSFQTGASSGLNESTERNRSLNGEESLVLDRIITSTKSIPVLPSPASPPFTVNASSFIHEPATLNSSTIAEMHSSPPQMILSSPHQNMSSLESSSPMQQMVGNTTENHINQTYPWHMSNASLNTTPLGLSMKPNNSTFSNLANNSDTNGFDFEFTLAKMQKYEDRFRSMCSYFAKNKNLNHDDMKFLYHFILSVSNRTDASSSQGGFTNVTANTNNASVASTSSAANGFELVPKNPTDTASAPDASGTHPSVPFSLNVDASPNATPKKDIPHQNSTSELKSSASGDAAAGSAQIRTPRTHKRKPHHKQKTK